MALTPEEIRAILGGSSRETPQEAEAAEAANAGFGTGDTAVSAWRTWKQGQLSLQTQQAQAALARSQASGSSESGNLAARLAELQLQSQQLEENRRQFQESFGADKAKYNTTVSGHDAEGNATLAGRQQALDEARFNEEKANNARDFQAAEYWRARGQELQQNQLTRDVTNDLYASKKGPQDWVDYWYRSRQMTPPAGAESVKVEDAIPAWARGYAPGTYPNSSGQGGYPGGASSFPGGAPAAARPGAAATGPRGTLNLPASTVGNPVTAQPAWAAAAPNAGRTAGPVGYGNGMFAKGTALGVGEGGVPISLSDYAVKNFKGPAWSGVGA